MSLRFHEIAEQRHRILNPFTDAKLQLVAAICRPQPGMQLLDLCCGKGEMLCQWSVQFGITGTGVDISPVFLAAARERALALQCADRVTFIEATLQPTQSALVRSISSAVSEPPGSARTDA
jgi:ubiquinone/menaquinone biosynthesis C-methylase UbiE